MSSDYGSSEPSPYLAGVESQHQGVPLDANTLPPSSPAWWEWRRGWLDAKAGTARVGQPAAEQLEPFHDSDWHGGWDG